MPGQRGRTAGSGRHNTRIWINPTKRVGLSAFRAARVKQKIVKVPKNEVVVTLGWSKTTVAVGVDLEKDLAIHQQGEKLDPREIRPADGAV